MKGSASIKTPPHELGTGTPQPSFHRACSSDAHGHETHRALTAQKEGRDTRTRGDDLGDLDGGASAFPNPLALHGLLRPGETTQGF